jgi:hypothetical protein
MTMDHPPQPTDRPSMTKDDSQPQPDGLLLLSKFAEALVSSKLSASQIDQLMVMFHARRELWNAIVPPVESELTTRAATKSAIQTDFLVRRRLHCT